MKRLLLILMLSLTAIFTKSQTAANFNANDCSANNHDLFTELNAGKVVVICWVMPCTNCASKALNAYNTCKSYSVSNPGQVMFYIADDYGDTPCASLKSWCDTSVALNCTIFSNSVVSMASYGAAGMPKTVVLAGITTHSVYFNQNGSAAGNSTAIKAAINQATADIVAAGIKENSSPNFNTKLFPSPVTNDFTVSYQLKQIENLSIEIYNSIGQKVKTIESASVIGKNELKISSDNLKDGNYFIKISNEQSYDIVKFLIAR